VTTIETPPEVATDALVVDNLDVAYRVRGTNRPVLRSVSFRIARGESYGLVGESGCGKSTAALTIVRYLPRNGVVTGGSVSIGGRDFLAMSGNELYRVRAKTVSMVYQDPSRALNPSLKIGRQVAEVFEVGGANRKAAVDRAEQALKRVRIADPGSVMQRYPHQLSGGMQQRVVIAMALAVEPALLILDEPTTGLDATVEAEVLDLVAALRGELSTTLLFISHHLGMIAKMCDRVGVLYAGELVEEGPALEVFNEPRHPYTVGLLRCVPRRGRRKDHGRLDTIPGFLPAPGTLATGCVFADRCALVEDRCRSEHPGVYDAGAGRTSRCHFHGRAGELPRQAPVDADAPPPATTREPLIRLRGMSKTFRSGGVDIHALTGVDIDIEPGEILGLVGESGSGKTTLARVLLGITAPDPGSVVELDGGALAGRTKSRRRDEVKAIQIVFQNPDSALNRRHSVRRLIGRSLSKLAGLSGQKLEDRLVELTRSVKLADRYLGMRPTQLSGGLKQRVAIARAFAGDPRLVVCDEPTSALDVSVQAAILNLLADLQRREGVTYLFISHDLGVVRYLSDRIAVLYLGRVMEIGPAETVFSGPHHPYTEALLSAVASVDGVQRERIRLSGEIPSAANPPSGCVFHTRCPRKLGDVCEIVEPPLADAQAGQRIRCHIPLDELRRLQARDASAASAAVTDEPVAASD
jgi:peptide/nickel transport system ATP-binding protein